MIKIELEERDAWEIAQLLKRITYEAVAECSIDKAETESILAAIAAMQSELKREGIAPR